MTLVVLMRHAEQRRGPHDPPDAMFSVGDHPLSEAGKRQAGAARDALRDVPLALALASPAKRARETARIVAEPHELPVGVRDGLREMAFQAPDEDPPTYGELLERIRDAARDLHGGGDPVLAGGMRFSAEVERGARALEAAVAEAGEAPVLVVAHGLLNRGILAHALGLPPQRAFALEQDHACIDLLDVRRGYTIVRQVNHVPGRLPVAQS